MRWWTLLGWMVRGDRPGHTAHHPASDPTQRASEVRMDQLARGAIDEDELHHAASGRALDRPPPVSRLRKALR